MYNLFASVRLAGNASSSAERPRAQTHAQTYTYNTIQCILTHILIHLRKLTNIYIQKISTYIHAYMLHMTLYVHNTYAQTYNTNFLLYVEI